MNFATYANILTSDRSTRRRRRASLLSERSPTTLPYGKVRDIGARLEPRYIFRARSFDQ